MSDSRPTPSSSSGSVRADASTVPSSADISAITGNEALKRAGDPRNIVQHNRAIPFDTPVRQALAAIIIEWLTSRGETSLSQKVSPNNLIIFFGASDEDQMVIVQIVGMNDQIFLVPFALLPSNQLTQLMEIWSQRFGRTAG